MQKKNTKPQCRATNSAIEFVAFHQTKKIPLETSLLEQKVLAMQTRRRSPFAVDSAASSPYQGFNLGLHVGDKPELVNKNRQYLEELLPEHTTIQWLDQVHSNKVAHIHHVSPRPITADAAITTNKKVCLAVMTADCLPILLSAKQGDEIAAIHGGWKPLAGNIIANTLNKMDTSAVELYAWLGPCIGNTVFEVGEEVRTAFISQDSSLSQAFVAKSHGKFLADLSMIAQIQLAHLGVKQIKVQSQCTFLNSDKYYSYRKKAVTGRMASLICFR
ncbi:MAG: peptidoglycan editing factor PgeF [Litorilituus sp.]|jgi:hypothetical protein|nr:peptidoglycan editing factor PgeF [Litorilituus sp.]